VAAFLDAEDVVYEEGVGAQLSADDPGVVGNNAWRSGFDKA
jgi:hypothetical protein